MFEEVSLQAELGAYVVALEVGGVHSWDVRYAIVSKRAGNTTTPRCPYYAYSTDCLNI